jgi:hypothetical protein
MKRFKAGAGVVMFLSVVVILTVFESGWWRWLVVAAGVPISIWDVNVILEYERLTTAATLKSLLYSASGARGEHRSRPRLLFPKMRRVCCSRISSAMLLARYANELRKRRVRLQLRHESAGMRPVSADQG